MNKSRRVDIDFLRGIAVISVIIFHLDPGFFPRGYLGVDLFFVISGYLITKSILKSYQSNSFKFSEFYLRRIKRILPVLLVVLFISSFFALIILLTSDLKRFTESLISSLGFVSNFYFWITGGYFATNNQLKPLLHLWSLSVEEQFYLFYPIFLYIIFKFFKSLNLRLIAVIIVSIFSFSLTLFFILKGASVPQQAIFFLSPFRVWQFGIGAIFAFLPNLQLKNIIIDSIYLLFAIFLIFFNFFNKISFLPEASIMCLGASLILYKSINEKNYLSEIFRIKPMIFIGIISYSLYLWHWPVISFLKYIYIEKITLTHMLFSVALIFCLSFLSWKFVEQPFLHKHSKRKVLSFVGIGYLILAVGAILILNSKNIPSRYAKYPNQIANAVGANYRCVMNLEKIIAFGDSYACFINTKIQKSAKTILYGNSHALMYGYAFKDYLLKTKEKGMTAGLSDGCLPFLDKNISLGCLEKSQAYFQSIIQSKNLKNIIIGFTWYTDELVDKKGQYFDKDFTLRRKSIDYLIDNLLKNNKTVYLIGPIDIPRVRDFPSRLSREIIFKKSKTIDTLRNRGQFDQTYYNQIEYYEKKLGKNFIQPHKLLCDKNNCYFADKNGSFFSDENHLSYYGSIKMKNIFNNIK